MTKKATKCTDPHTVDRAKGTKVPPSSVIAACALEWIAVNVEAVFYLSLLSFARF